MPRTPAPRLRFLLAWAAFTACGQTGGGCTGGAAGCGTLAPIPGGQFRGDKLDSAAAVRLTADGFGVVNTFSPELLELFAPGGMLLVPLACNVQSALLENLTIADEGQISCGSESCGQLDGKCNTLDAPKQIAINVTSLSLAPKGPDLLEANLDLTLATGKIMVSSVFRASPLCLFSGPVKCSLDFDTTRAAPGNNQLQVNIKMTVDPRWDRVLTVEIAEIGGSKTCGTSGALPRPQCLDPADILIVNEGGCSGACSAANFSLVKTLLLDQLTKALKDKLEEALKGANCRACGPAGECPTSAVAMSSCEVKDGGSLDAGECTDTGTGQCVPALLGVEGRMALGQALGGLVPGNASMDLSFAAGGGSTASDAGLTLGFRGGAKEAAAPICVKPLLHAPDPVIPLPDLDLDAPGAYDVGLTLSQQLLSRALFHAQQSGALCLELGNEQVSALESGLLGTLLPSLNKLTGKDVSVPLRLAIRPINPPTATLGEGTLDPQTNKPLEPLIRFEWLGVEIDLYAKLDERYVRLMTLTADVKLPLGLSLSNCSDLTPVIGDLAGAITNVKAKNSEILAEDLKALELLVPSLITFAEPALARGFSAFTVPTFGGWRLRLIKAQGVGRVTGTKNYNHLGLYANLLPPNAVCMPLLPGLSAALASHQGSRAKLAVTPIGVGEAEYQVRVNGGFWTTWRKPGADGLLEVNHPRLLLNARHQLEVRVRDAARPGAVSELVGVAVVP